MLDNLVVSIKEHEGFVDHVYQDHLGNDTLGYGTLMPISKLEATLLLRTRLYAMIEALKNKQPVFNRLPKDVQAILAEMAYQMGVNGLLKFKKTWKYLEDFEFEKAADEGLNSLWAKQTPNRANELMSRLRKTSIT